MKLEGKFAELAVMLADERAWEILEDEGSRMEFVPYGGNVIPAGEHYIDLRRVYDGDKEVVAEALEYLSLRGLARYHPERPHLLQRYPDAALDGALDVSDKSKADGGNAAAVQGVER